MMFVLLPMKRKQSKVRNQFCESFNDDETRPKLLIVFGPEGGLAEEEIVMLREHKFVPCSLGPRILRTETALYALSLLRIILN